MALAAGWAKMQLYVSGTSFRQGWLKISQFVRMFFTYIIRIFLGFVDKLQPFLALMLKFPDLKEHMTLAVVH